MPIPRTIGSLTAAIAVLGVVIGAAFFFVKNPFNGGQRATEADMPPVQWGDDTPSSFGEYTIREDGVYYQTIVYYAPAETIFIAEADPETFEVLQGDFAKDASRIYFGGEALEEAHPESFMIILSRPLRGRSPSFSKDASSVFVNTIKIQGADPASFRILDNERYQLDQRFVYYKGMRLHEADPATFQIWGGTPYAKDQASVYVNDAVLQGADATTFEALTNYKAYSLWAKDAGAVYWYGQKIPGADASTFELYWDRGLDYGKDIQRVYYHGTIVDGADPQTFQAPN